MSNSALLSVATVDLRNAGADSSFASDSVSFREAVDLADVNGGGCCNPSGITIEDLDRGAEIAGGGYAVVPVRHKVLVRIPCGQLAPDARQRLERWMLERRDVTFGSGLGERTSVSWYPGMGDTDLAGNAVAHNYDASRQLFFDTLMGTERFIDCAGQRVVPTPFGSGLVGEGEFTNEALPAGYGYPRSGSIGWIAGGGATATYTANGFGYADCPNSVLVVGDGSGSNEYVYMPLSHAVTPSTALYVSACVMIRGRLPSTATIRLYDNNGSDYVVSSLVIGESYAGSDGLGDWTPVYIHAHKTWDGLGGGALLYIGFHRSGTGRAARFEIGPTAVRVSSDSYRQGWPNWQDAAAAKAAEYDTITAPMRGAQTLHFAFFVPPWFDVGAQEDEVNDFYCGMLERSGGSNNTGKLNIVYGATAGKLRAQYTCQDDGAGHTVTITAPFTPRPGSAHVVSFVGEHAKKSIYLDGRLAYSTVAASYQMTNPHGTGWRVSRSVYGSWPFVPLAFRVDDEAQSPRRVAGVAAALSTYAAVSATVAARGRIFRVRSIPSVPAGTLGGDMHFGGVLELEQVGYDEAAADITSKEAV